MDNIYWLVDKLPISLVLHDKSKILHANEAFRNFLTKEEQCLEKLEFTQWLARVIKIQEQHRLLIDGIENNNEVTITTEGCVKGTLRHWIISSFPLSPQLSTEKIQLTYLQDVSALHDKKSYWDLHLRVSKATIQLLKEIAERKKLEVKTAELNNQLIITSRRAGMADVATSVLHNVGNILNSVKVSISSLKQDLNKSEFKNLIELIGMIQAHLDDIDKYFKEDPKGKLIPQYLTTLVKSLVNTHEKSNNEMNNLTIYLQHIEDIVAMQESTSKAIKMEEKISLSETLNASLQLCGNTFEKNNIEIQKKYGDDLFLISDKFKILQVLVNLLQNAKDALLSPDSDIPVKKIIIQVKKDGANVDILISDNGIGIDPKNMTKIFSLGFTTKINGHGYGLHSSALAAKELGGTLQATSNGIGQGATFALTLPISLKD